MSEQENTNIVKQTYECFLRGDIESLLKLYADDVQWEVYGAPQCPDHGGCVTDWRKWRSSLRK
jgi:ketosteroid isomerase-like protein